MARPQGMTYEDLRLMVAEGLEDMDAETLVKVVRAMYGARIRWSNAKDCYLVNLPD
jgi:hypothetical protein